MKNFALLLGVLLTSINQLRGQVTVEVTFDQEEFLPGESLSAAIRITNRSGQTLNLGADEGWLTFSVESAERYVVVKTAEVPVAGKFTLESSQRAIKSVDLAPYFNLSKPGRYSVTATVNIKEWNRQVVSPPKAFDIIEGSKMWEQEVGLPKSPDATNQMPEMRKYVLHQANYLRRNLMLYVQVSDASGKVRKVFPIGRMLSFGQPEPQVDRLSNLHVLYQDGPKTFSYTVVNPDGDVLIHQTYDMPGRPRLKVDEEGNLKVVGGTRRIKPNDIPAPKISADNAQTSRP
jgi:hypothetical protein